MPHPKETRTITIERLEEIANTLRMVANTLGSSKRTTCLDRNIMRSWNEVVDMINNHEPTSTESLGYYMREGQTPTIK